MEKMNLKWTDSKKTRIEAYRGMLKMYTKSVIRILCIFSILLLCIYLVVKKSGPLPGIDASIESLFVLSHQISLELFFIYIWIAFAALIFVFLCLLVPLSALEPTKYELTDKQIARNGHRIVYWHSVWGYSLIKNRATDEEPAILLLHFKRRKKYQRGIILPEGEPEKLNKVIAFVAERAPLIEEVEPGSLHAKLIDLSRRISESD